MSDGIPQSRSDLQSHLHEHLQFLESSAAAFDAGFDAEAKRLAVSIRVLLHDTDRSHSLLSQLNLKNVLFYDTAIDYEPDNLLTHGGIVAIAIAPGAKPEYIAMLDDLPMNRIPQLNFESWWNKAVFVDRNRKQLTRRDLVLAVADQDGGAHVDPSLDEKYAELSRFNSLAWMSSFNGTVQPMGGPERAAIRQVAHEVIKSLKPGYAKKPDLRGKTIVASGTAKVMDITHLPLRTSRKAKVGRNDPCPCGSLKKYKKCCGR